jgi:hypothetical protein
VELVPKPLDILGSQPTGKNLCCSAKSHPWQSHIIGQTDDKATRETKGFIYHLQLSFFYVRSKISSSKGLISKDLMEDSENPSQSLIDA